MILASRRGSGLSPLWRQLSVDLALRASISSRSSNAREVSNATQLLLAATLLRTPDEIRVESLLRRRFLDRDRAGGFESKSPSRGRLRACSTERNSIEFCCSCLTFCCF